MTLGNINAPLVRILCTTNFDVIATNMQVELDLRRIPSIKQIFDRSVEMIDSISNNTFTESVLMIIIPYPGINLDDETLERFRPKNFKGRIFSLITTDDFASSKVFASSKYLLAIGHSSHVAQIAKFAAAHLGEKTPSYKEIFDKCASEGDFASLFSYHLRSHIDVDETKSETRKYESVDEFSKQIGQDRDLVVKWIRGETLPVEIENNKEIIFDGNSQTDSYIKDLNFVLEIAKDYNLFNSPSLETVPSQQPHGILFGGDEDSPIDLISISSPSETLDHDLYKAEEYGEIRAKAEELQSLGSNRLGRLSRALDRFLDLPSDAADVRVKILWSRSNTLRIILDDHEATFNSNHIDERALEPLAASHLKDLVETINVFFLGNPVLMDFDAARPGPQDIMTDVKTIELVRPLLLEASTARNLTTGEAGTEISHLIDIKYGGNLSLDARQGQKFNSQSARNFIAELLRRAYLATKRSTNFLNSEVALAKKRR